MKDTKHTFGGCKPHNIPLIKKPSEAAEPKKIVRAERTGLFDSQGYPIFASGLTVQDVVDAINAAADAGHLDVALELAEQYDVGISTDFQGDMPEFVASIWSSRSKV
jgi:hypothetical protein